MKEDESSEGVGVPEARTETVYRKTGCGGRLNLNSVGWVMVEGGGLLFGAAQPRGGPPLTTSVSLGDCMAAQLMAATWKLTSLWKGSFRTGGITSPCRPSTAREWTAAPHLTLHSPG